MRDMLGGAVGVQSDEDVEMAKMVRVWCGVVWRGVACRVVLPLQVLCGEWCLYVASMESGQALPQSWVVAGAAKMRGLTPGLAAYNDVTGLWCISL